MRFIGIDPSTKTGFVVLDKVGNVLEEREIAYQGKDPERMYKLVQGTAEAVKNHLLKSPIAVCIEGFGFGSQQAVQLGGIGWGIRMKLHEEKVKYIEVAPGSLKKFTGAGGNAPKERLAVEVYKRWQFDSKSNNITDAFVLAQIARAVHEPTVILTKFQQEVLDTVLATKSK